MPRKPSLTKSLPALRRVLAYFWPWIRTERRLIAAGVGALVSGVLFRLVEPWPLKLVLDRVIPVDSAGGPGWVGSLDTRVVLALAAAAVVVFTGLRAVTDYYHRVGFAKVGNRVLRRIRDHAYRHLQGLSLSFHNRARRGDLIVRVTRDVSLLRDVTSTAILPLLANGLVLVGMAVVMLVLEWRLTLIAAAVLPLFWLSTVRIGRGIHAAARKQRSREGAMASAASESMHAIESVKALSLEDTFADRFSSRNSESQKEEMKGARLTARLGRTVDLLLAVATALVLWFGAHSVLAGRMTPGDLVLFLAYLKRAFKPAKDFAKYTGRLAKAAAAGERVMDILDQSPEVRDLPDAVPAPPLRGAVRFEGVDFHYEPEKPILRDVSLEIAPGMRVAITGESGVGKSTLVGLLMRLMDPVRGRVLLDGRDVREYTLKSLRPQISVVLQDTVLFATTVAENIAIGSSDVGRDRIETCARLSVAHDFIEELPEGYDTMLGERGVNLSHGQRQRIAIARAAMRETPFLVLDEPTTGLDPESERLVVESLEAVAEGRTTFLITHDSRLARRADLVLHLGDRRILECGSPRELLDAGGPFARACRLQSTQEQIHAE